MRAVPKVRPAALVDDLGIERGDSLFIKSSMNWLGFGAADTLELLQALVDRVGPSGLIAMPSFPYPNEIGRPPDGAIFDVVKTPSQMGLLSEMFRRWPGTYRSEHFWVPIVAWGLDAEALTDGQTEILNPFGEDSSFRRLTGRATKMVGIGVSTNYNVLSHVADAILHDRYPRPVFTSEPVEASIIDRSGRTRTMRSILVTQDWRRRMKPGRMIERSPSLSQALRFLDYGGGWAWTVPAQLFLHEAIVHGRKSLENGCLPPWIEG